MADETNDRLAPLHGALASVSSALSAAPEVEDAAAPQATEVIERLRDIADLLERLVVETPETVISNNLIATLIQQLQPVSTALPQLATEPAASVTVLNTATENLLAAVGAWPVSPRLDEDTGRRIARVVEKRADALSRQAEERVAVVGTAVTELENHVQAQRQAIDAAAGSASTAITARAAEVEASLTAARAQADAIVPELQQRFDSAEAARQQTHTEAIARLTEDGTAQVQQVKAEANTELTTLKTEIGTLREALANEKTRLDAVSTQQQQQFNDAQEQRTKEFATQRDQASSAAKKEREEQAARAEEQLAEMQRMLEETQRVANAVANTGTATAYGKDAKDEKRAADRWRLVAIGLGMLAAVVAFVTLALRPPDGNVVNYISTAGRFAVATALGAVATYAGRQSSQHRRREERSRQIELELTAFGPFVEGLDDNTKRELRADYVRRLFRGLAGAEASEKDGDASGQAQLTPIGQAVDAFSGLTKPR